MKLSPILVQKFGGTSVATPERRQHVIEHVREARTRGRQVAVVVSAMGRRGDPYATDTLLDLLRSGGRRVNPCDYDLMFTCGEAIAAAVVSHELALAGMPARALTSAQARIYTDGQHVESQIVRIDSGRLRDLLVQDIVPVVTGGQGVTEGSLDFTTLGRGGSDTSAVALGLALGAERVEIFTDVEGVAVTDPRLVPGARVLRRISYAAMSEMARFGAGVLHPRSIGAAWNGRIPLAVRSTFSSGPGTLVDAGEDDAGIVGFTWLPAMETITLPPHAANETLRREWESRRLVMSVTDSGSGCLAAGAAADRASNSSLEETLASVNLVPVRREGLCAWLSLVGSCGALAEACPRVLAALARQDVAVRACEIGPRRCTVIVPAESGNRSARITYDLVWPTAPVIPESALPNPES